MFSCEAQDKVKFMPSNCVAGRTVRQLENSGHDSLLEKLSNITVTIPRTRPASPSNLLHSSVYSSITRKLVAVNLSQFLIVNPELLMTTVRHLLTRARWSGKTKPVVIIIRPVELCFKLSKLVVSNVLVFVLK